ncbi:hypothetical protein [Streptomyces sp. NBC_01571]|nr:hypothetical protein [Streptomyces sp. NBC_01571]MCX4577350.1 hypothetical protein [Streptomyces sp. NBC_01571]
MSDDVNFDDRMFMESQAVYQRILDGQVTDVVAELMDAQLRASEESE